MKDHDSFLHHELPLLTNPAVWICALAGALTMSTAHAAYANDAKQQYEADKAYCSSGQATEPRALCLKEAARAYAEAKKGTLDSSSMDAVEPTSAGPTSGKTRHHKHRAKPSASSTKDNSSSSTSGSTSSDTTSGSTAPSGQTQPQGTTR